MGACTCRKIKGVHAGKGGVHVTVPKKSRKKFGLIFIKPYMQVIPHIPSAHGQRSAPEGCARRPWGEGSQVLVVGDVIRSKKILSVLALCRCYCSTSFNIFIILLATAEPHLCHFNELLEVDFDSGNNYDFSCVRNISTKLVDGKPTIRGKLPLEIGLWLIRKKTIGGEDSGI